MVAIHSWCKHAAGTKTKFALEAVEKALRQRSGPSDVAAADRPTLMSHSSLVLPVEPFASRAVQSIITIHPPIFTTQYEAISNSLCFVQPLFATDTMMGA